MSKFDTIDIVDVITGIRFRKRLALLLIGAVIVLTFLSSILITKKYTSEAGLLPMGQIETDSGSGNLAGLASKLIGGSGLDDRLSKVLMSILISRDIRERVAKRPDLFDILAPEKGFLKIADESQRLLVRLSSAAGLLSKLTKIKTDKVSIFISIITTHPDPLVAQKITTAYIEELEGILNDSAFTTARRNRIFLEGRVKETKLELLDLGDQLSKFLTRNPVSTESEIRVPSAPDRKVPLKVYLQYLEEQRKSFQTLHSMITSEYELARIQESKDKVSFQVIDKPSRPLFPSWPNKLILLIGFSVLAFVIMVCVLLYDQLVRQGVFKPRQRGPQRVREAQESANA